MGLGSKLKSLYNWFLRQPKVYTAILFQNGSAGNPTATVLGDNSIGNVIWSRTAAGKYRGTLTGAFTLGKTAVSFSDNCNPMTPETGDANDSNVKTYALVPTSQENYVEVKREYYDSSAGLMVGVDGITRALIRIEVYS